MSKQAIWDKKTEIRLHLARMHHYKEVFVRVLPDKRKFNEAHTLNC